ncbi:MAG: 3-methylornithyl-N6-L-lysine dehydrogenase PylD [Candidatus Methanosuratincola petrocarbonis]
MKSKDVESIPFNILEYDRNLTKNVGADLLEIAKLAAGFNGNLRTEFQNYRAKVVPITAGKGMINGFAEAVASILNYIGLDAKVASIPDVGGFAEALRDKCSIIFAADDEYFVGFNLRTSKYTYNFDATGRAYAAALEIKAGGLGGKSVALIGAGRVGSAAADFLCEKGATVYVFDIVADKTKVLKDKHPESIICCDSLVSCISKAKLVLLTAPGKKLIPARLISNDRIFSVPAMPLGFTRSARSKLRKENLIHDNLELGVAAMAVDLVI